MNHYLLPSVRDGTYICPVPIHLAWPGLAWEVSEENTVLFTDALREVTGGPLLCAAVSSTINSPVPVTIQFRSNLNGYDSARRSAVLAGELVLNYMILHVFEVEISYKSSMCSGGGFACAV